MYSILKSAWPQAPSYIARIQHKLTLPSRLVLLSARLVLANKAGQRPPPIPSVNRFRRLIYGSDASVPNFLKDLEAFVQGGGSQVFKLAKNLLTSGDYALPPVLATDLAQKSPATFFLLLRWIDRMEAAGLDPSVLDEERRRKLLGFVTAFGWFATSADKVVENVWPELENAAPGELAGFFCRKSFDNVVKLGERGGLQMLPLVTPDMLQAAIKDAVTAGSGRSTGFNDPTDKFWDEWNLWANLSGYVGDNLRSWFAGCLGDTWRQGVTFDGDRLDLTVIYRDAWTRFINNLWGNRSLLLYAQRISLATWFPDHDPSEPDQVEDKNRPWDFDHIHPQRYLVSDTGGSFWHIPTILKDWHRSIGNLRAWPMEANRSDSDAAPAIKLGSISDVERSYRMADAQEVRKASYIGDEDWPFWQGCVPNAANAPRQYLRDVNNYGKYRKPLLQAITTRFVALYREWYDELRIRDLMPACGEIEEI